MKINKNKKIKILIFILIILFAYPGKLQAITIVLDPGHGGMEPGAINIRDGMIESDITYKIAIYLKAYLEQYENIKVIITRKESENKNLQQRADVAFDNNADLLLSLHINSYEYAFLSGCERICYIQK